MTNAMALEKIRSYCERALDEFDYTEYRPEYVAGVRMVAENVLAMLGKDPDV